jgi:ligand-binding sensor domain-containing protein
LYSWADDHITFITEDPKRALWIGTFENGIIRYDPSSKKINHYSAQKDSVGNFSDSTTWWAFTSREGVMWMSTWNNELYKFDPLHQNVVHRDLKRAVNSFLEGPGDNQWIGTDSGLLYVDKKNNTALRFINDPKKPESISNNVVWVVCKGSANRLWVGTVGGGLNLFNPEKQNFTSYKHDPKNNRSLIRNEVYGLYEDEQSTFG